MYCSYQYLSIDPEKSLPRPLLRPQTAKTCDAHNFEMYWSRQYLSIDPKKICRTHSNAHNA